ncbi:hypothetical protein Cni_G15644 [Canna indica]|uniref:DUF674 domain-containing protein n=1 Tax=Canna indica TaxID=4628 RepID=A0AAQ3KDR5_9LILI|nr:hypothetical protein Cni_G15644 [Canna indica]
MKLLVDKSTRKVLFAEAGKEAVDFLIGLLQIPIVSVVKLLTKERMVGAIGNLYKSMENFGDSFLLSKNTKSLLLNPSCPTSQPHSSSEYYKCSMCNANVKVNYVEGSGTEVSEASNGGYVKGAVTYTVMDDLTIKPMTSTISSITFLKYNVRNLAALEVKIVKLGFDEVRAAAAQGLVGVEDCPYRRVLGEEVRVNADRAHGRVLEQGQFDEKMIESLVGYNMQSSTKIKEAKSKTPSPNKHVMEHKRLQNITILMKALNASTKQVCNALMIGRISCSMFGTWSLLPPPLSSSSTQQRREGEGTRSCARPTFGVGPPPNEKVASDAGRPLGERRKPPELQRPHQQRHLGILRLLSAGDWFLGHHVKGEDDEGVKMA